jgi:hypothetical protein
VVAHLDEALRRKPEGHGFDWNFQLTEPFNAGIKSLHATLPDEIFYWGFCLYMRENPTNATIIDSVS